jgi:hypothetical protein
MWITGYIQKYASLGRGGGYHPMSSRRTNEYRKEETGGGKERNRKNERKLEAREEKNIIFRGRAVAGERGF